MPSHVELPAAPLSAGVQVQAPGNQVFGDYVGIVQMIATSPNYRRLVFPAHPWQTDGVTWAFRVDELEVVGHGESDVL